MKKLTKKYKVDIARSFVNSHKNNDAWGWLQPFPQPDTLREKYLKIFNFMDVAAELEDVYSSNKDHQFLPHIEISRHVHRDDIDERFEFETDKANEIAEMLGKGLALDEVEDIYLDEE